MSFLRKSSENNPLTQEEILQFVKQYPQELFEVMKIKIPVQQTKSRNEQRVQTVTIARDGRRIAETTNIVPEGYGIDTRICIDGSVDQYAKNPQRVETDYSFDDGRYFSEVDIGETVSAHTKRKEIRKAFVASCDLWLKAKWGAVQFVAKGGIITISGTEAIGNNNPCDMVIYHQGWIGHTVLTRSAREIRYELNQAGIPLTSALKKFLRIATREDIKSPYISKWVDFRMWMKAQMQTLKKRLKCIKVHDFEKKNNKIGANKCRNKSKNR